MIQTIFLEKIFFLFFFKFPKLQDLRPKPLHHIMDGINNHGKDTPYAIRDQSLKMANGLLLAHL